MTEMESINATIATISPVSDTFPEAIPSLLLVSALMLVLLQSIQISSEWLSSLVSVW